MTKPGSNEKTKKVQKLQKGTHQPSCLFRGYVFAFLRLSPPSDAVDFDTKELELCIAAHGGQILSSQILKALRADKASGLHQTRTCYVLCWGGYTPIQITVHPLLSRVESEKLCSVVPVTPIWLQTCSADRKIVAPEKRPVLFQPQPWPIRRLEDSMSLSSKLGGIKVSMTGFVRSERTGIIHVLRVLGALYTENMLSSNTHLICKETKGPKYDKAVKWGLHVVSVNWLFHIMEYGYGGKDGDEKTGCEDRFSLVPTNGRAKHRKSRELTTKEATFKMSQESAGSDGAISLFGEFESQYSQEVLGTEQVLPPEQKS
jgi:topoisomerase (DNA) II binding protein 1